MKKRNYSLMLFLMFFAIILPFGVKADEVSTADELNNCLASDGKTCKLTANINDMSTIDVNGGTVVLDLNGYNISFAKSKRLNIRKGNFTITGKGKISESVSSSGPVVIYGSINENDTNYTTVTFGKDVTLEGCYGSFISINKDSNGVSHAYGVTVNINGTLIGKFDGNKEYGSGFYINGFIKDFKNAPVVNISSSAVLKGVGGGIYAAGYGVWNINGAKLEGENYGAGIKTGKLNFNDATVTATGEKNSGTYNGDGINGTGAAIQIESNDLYAGNIEITINGGIYKSNNGNVIYHYKASKTTKSANNALVSLDIISGLFTGDLEVYDDDNITINSGSFSYDVTKFVDGMSILTKDNDAYIVSLNKKLETNDEKVIFESKDALNNSYKLIFTSKDEDELSKNNAKVSKVYEDNTKIKNLKLISLFDISVVDINNRVVPMENGDYTISLSLSDDMLMYDNYNVLYFDEDGNVGETIDAKIIDGKLVFSTSHLSSYGVVGYNNVGSTDITNNTSNPNTFDGSMISMIITFVSLISLFGTIKVLENRK